jgi:hypothetical protein
MAHEIGPLLGSIAHSATGIMKAKWNQRIEAHTVGSEVYFPAGSIIRCEVLSRIRRMRVPGPSQCLTMQNHPAATGLTAPAVATAFSWEELRSFSAFLMNPELCSSDNLGGRGPDGASSTPRRNPDKRVVETAAVEGRPSPRSVGGTGPAPDSVRSVSCPQVT